MGEEKLNNYETIIILKSDISKEEYSKITRDISTEITKLTEHGTSVTLLDKKHLAYEVQGYNEGYFAVFKYQIASDKSVDITHQVDALFRKEYSGTVIKFLTTKTTEEEFEIETGDESYEQTIAADHSQVQSIDAYDVLLGRANYK